MVSSPLLTFPFVIDELVSGRVSPGTK